MRTRSRYALLAGAVLAVASFAPATASGAVKTLDDVTVLQTLTVGGSTQFGWALAELQDIDADGVTDLIVADDPGGPAGTGAVYVYSGASGALLHQFSEGAGGRFGYAIADAGDVDADGTHDIIVGRPGSSAAYVYSGATGAPLLTLTAPSAELAGVAVASAGDINADGHDDLLVGAQRASLNGTNAGRVYVFSGADGSVLRAIDGSVAGDLFGTATDSVPDIDGDGVPEHAIGARDAGKWSDGGVWLYSGSSGTLMWRFLAPKPDAEVGSFFVAGIPDVSGDGKADVYVGDYAATTTASASGRAYVLSGADGSVVRTTDGESVKDGLGPGREAGDLNDDGVGDLVIGSYSSRDGAPAGGRFDVFSGSDGSRLATVVGTVAGAQLGFDAIGLGDVDGDGVPDVAVAAATGNTVYVISGASLLP
jgi:hypothetical protein